MEVIKKADHILLKAIGWNYLVNIKGKGETANGRRQTADGKRNRES